MTKMMNRAIKQRWLAALRSDEYVQAKGALNINDCYCVLGVLCDLYHKEHPDSSGWVRADDLGNDRYTFNLHTEADRSAPDYLPPLDVFSWAGIEIEPPENEPTVEVEAVAGSASYRTTLSHLNDSGFDFDSLAAIIEKEL